jgi:adenylate cyclase
MSSFLRPFRLLRELRRRRVLKVAAIYAAVAWLVIQIAETSFPYLSLPGWAVTLVIVLALSGFPFALVLSWAYDLTPDGVERTPADERMRAEDRRTRGVGENASMGEERDRAPGRSAAATARSRAPVFAAGAVIAMLGSVAYFAGSRAEPEAGDTAPAAFRSIAVLPFVNMSAEASNEYFSDGLTEELLNGLAQVDGLRVAARTSAFAFKGVNENVTEIGRRLNVEAVLEGSVRRTGDKLRITAQLINVADGYHLWSETFDDHHREDIFAIQDEIARAIVQKLLPRFAGGDVAAVHGSTSDVQAYDEYLKGRYAFWQGTSENNLRAAIRHYEAAVERDPGYALAWAGLSDAWMLLGGEHARPTDVFPQAKAAALRALELDDQLAEGYVALASISWFYDWDWEAAERNYRRSFSVNRAVYTRCICYVWYLAVLGDYDAAVREGERVRALDPAGHLPLTTLAQMYHLAGRHDDARATLRVLEEAGSSSAVIPRLRAWLAWDAGRREEAVATLERFRDGFAERGGFAETAPARAVAELAYMYGQTGRAGEARQLAGALHERAAGRYVPPELVAAAFAAAGDDADAAAWLDRAVEGRSNLGMFSAFPVSRALQHVPRYRAALLRVGVPMRGSTAPLM